jgi:hypothetical protein
VNKRRIIVSGAASAAVIAATIGTAAPAFAGTGATTPPVNPASVSSLLPVSTALPDTSQSGCSGGSGLVATVNGLLLTVADVLSQLPLIGGLVGTPGNCLGAGDSGASALGGLTSTLSGLTVTVGSLTSGLTGGTSALQRAAAAASAASKSPATRSLGHVQPAATAVPKGMTIDGKGSSADHPVIPVSSGAVASSNKPADVIKPVVAPVKAGTSTK